MNQARPSIDRLVEDHLHLVRPIARSLAGFDQDAHSAGLFGLFQAARRYDPARGEFAVYAKHAIRGAVLDYLARPRLLLGLSSPEADPRLAAPLSVESLDIRRAILWLPWAQRMAIQLRYFHGCNQEETARRMSITLYAEKQLQRRALRSLRIYFGVGRTP